MMKLVKKYQTALIFAFAMFGIYLYSNSLGSKAFDISLENLGQMLSFLPAIFILVGLLDVWIPKETMIKYMGDNSGIKGILIAFFLGSAAAGPLYAAFPVAALLLKKGARLAYVLIFLGAWSSTKLPLILFEIASLGVRFTVIHVSVSIVSFLAIAFLMEKLTSQESKVALYEKAKSL